MKPLKALTSRTLVLDQDNIDTDQIIPARFLTTTQREGLARAAFADWRFDAEDRVRPDCALNASNASQCQILVAGDNFGCGSSREHAVWALEQFGFRAVISARLADIFRANALKNGLLAIELEPTVVAWLRQHPGVELAIRLDDCRVTLPDGSSHAFELDPFARTCLIEGVDALGYLLAKAPLIARHEASRAGAF